MFKKQVSWLLCLIFVLQFFLIACSGENISVEKNEIEEELLEEAITEEAVEEITPLYSGYEQHFNHPMVKKISSEESILGDLDNNFVSIEFPENTFSEEVNIELFNPDTVPDVKPENALAIGAPININLDSDSKRFDQEVIITMKLTPAELEGVIHEEEIMIAYYNGQNWDYIMPKEVNFEEAYIRFGTYHFSPYLMTKPTKAKRIDNFLEKKSRADWAVGSGIEGSDVVLEKMVNDMVKQKFGTVNKNLVQDVVEGIMQQDDYAKLVVSYKDYVETGSKNQDAFEGIALDYSVLVGKHLFEVIDTVDDYSDLKGGLLQNLGGAVADNAGQMVTGVKMAEALAQGKYEDAAKHLSNEIIGSFPVTKFLQTGADVIDRQINRWKSEELEAAFKVYVNGADGGYWGYNVRANDFDGLWLQMRGLREKIYTDAIADYAKTHNLGTDFWGQPNVDMLGHASLNKIRQKAKAQIKREFEARKNREAEITELKKTNAALLESFENAYLLTSNRYGYDALETSIEERLSELFKLRDKVVRDVGKPLGIHRGSLGENITVAHMVQLITILKSSTGGEDAYKEKLIEMGYIEPPIDLSGKWIGTLTITEIPPPGQPIILCDEVVEMDWEQYRGIVLNAEMNLSGAEGTFNGNAIISPPGDEEPLITDIRASERKDGNFVFSSEMLNGTLKYSKKSGQTLNGMLQFEAFGIKASLKKVGN